MANTFDTEYGVTPWEDFETNQRTVYVPELLETFRNQALFYKIVTYGVNLRAQRTQNMVFTRPIDPEPNIQTIDLRALWLPQLYMDSQAVTITTERHVRIATEGALLGSVLEHGLDPGLAIISDDAGQFNVLLHGLCWIHAERTINKLVGFTTENREALAKVRSQIWDFYAELKAYKEVSSEEKKVELEARFDELFTAKTCFVSLNLALKRLYKNKSELLLVLDRPDIPLHNNLSEGDIREYVKKRKISGSTRSECGRRCRDTFTSLKKTCRKLGVPFWRYLNDRISRKCEIPPLSELIRQQSLAPET